MEKVTVCIPFYNDSKYLNYAILSVINQSYLDWKLILLDDGSTDGSLDIAKSFLGDSRIRLISDGYNKGLIYRLNQSIDLVDTEYYARMDADDIMHPKRIETQLNILVKNKHIDVLGTSAYSIDSDNNIRGLRGCSDNSLIKTSVFIHPSIIGKIKWFKSNKYNVLAERFEDYELWHRTIENSTFYHINTPLLFYREFGGAYYKKYYRTYQTSLQYLYKESSLSVKDKLHYLQFSLKCFIKSIVYKLYFIVEKEDKLIRKRFKPFHHNKISEEAEFYLKEAISYNKK